MRPDLQQSHAQRTAIARMRTVPAACMQYVQQLLMPPSPRSSSSHHHSHLHTQHMPSPSRRKSSSVGSHGNASSVSVLVIVLLSCVASVAVLLTRDAALLTHNDAGDMATAASLHSAQQADDAAVKLNAMIERSVASVRHSLNHMRTAVWNHDEYLRHIDRRVAAVEHEQQKSIRNAADADASDEALASPGAMQPLHMCTDGTTGVPDDPDYALASAGAYVLWHTETVERPAPVSIGWSRTLQHVLARHLLSADPAANDLLLTDKGIEPPGDCLPLNGTAGKVDIRLADSIVITAVAISHLQPLLAFDRSSAPLEIEVYAWSHNDGEHPDDATFLGMLVYTLEGQPMQALELHLHEHEAPPVFDSVRLHVLSNNGKAEYTCLYRVSVRGKQSFQSMSRRIQ